MDSQIYLLLLRQSGSYKDWYKELKTATKVTAPLLVKQILKDIVFGDSLDAPFVKFIRVSSLKHELGFDNSDEAEFESSGWAYKDAWNEETQYDPNPFLRSTTTSSPAPFYNQAGWKGVGKHHLGEWGTGNQFVQSRVPGHGQIVFTKHIDSATPQLAYGCSAQEKFPLAMFFYRRKTGLGLGGIRFPYFVTGAFKCKIQSWELEDDQEKVSLYYKQIAWCGYDQWADTNVSYPWSTRWFDQEKFKGGQGGSALAVQMIVAALVLVAGGVSEAASAASAGTSSGDSGDL